MILCMCPMCQLNLDGYQGRVNGYFGTQFNLPIMYFTQMLGIAFGLDPKKLGFGKELVAAMPVLKAKLNGQLAAAACENTSIGDAQYLVRQSNCGLRTDN